MQGLDKNDFSTYSMSQHYDRELLLGFQSGMEAVDGRKELLSNGFQSLDDLYDAKMISKSEYEKRYAFLQAYKDQNYSGLEIEEDDDSEDEFDGDSWQDKFQHCLGGCLRCGQTIWQALEHTFMSK